MALLLFLWRIGHHIHQAGQVEIAVSSAQADAAGHHCQSWIYRRAVAARVSLLAPLHHDIPGSVFARGNLAEAVQRRIGLCKRVSQGLFYLPLSRLLLYPRALLPGLAWQLPSPVVRTGSSRLV